MSQLQRLSLLIRKRLPTPVRSVLRVLKYASSKPSLSPVIPPNLVEDCRVCADRVALLQHMKKGATVAEVGTEHGNFARLILTHCAPNELHLIDLDMSELAADVRADQRVSLHAGMSADTLESFPANHFDWIYIDADHSFAGVTRDIQAAAPRVKPGGFLIFNDFAHADPHLGQYGVHRAVCEFAVRDGWQIRWLALEQSALYDVALQKPA